MNVITCRKEQSLLLGGVFRLLVLHHDSHAVRLALAAPPGIEILPETIDAPTRRHDLICWHPDPPRLMRQIRSRFPDVADDLHQFRTGVAWLGSDPCTLALLEAYVQGLCDADSSITGDSHFVRNIPPCNETT